MRKVALFDLVMRVLTVGMVVWVSVTAPVDPVWPISLMPESQHFLGTIAVGTWIMGAMAYVEATVLALYLKKKGSKQGDLPIHELPSKISPQKKLNPLRYTLLFIAYGVLVFVLFLLSP